MAPKNPNSAFFVIALILDAQSLLNLFSGQSITGTLCCPGSPVSGATVSYNFTNLLGANVLVGQNTTGANGFFNITVPKSNPYIVEPVSMPGLDRLSSAICPILSTINGTLIGVGVLGLVQAVRIVGFVNAMA